MKHKRQYHYYRSDLRERARYLRNNSTRAEIELWKQVRNRSLGVQIHRQVPIRNFIVDFYSHEIKLAIELDGPSHVEAGIPEYDKIRQEQLENLGITVIRFDDDLVFTELEAVLEAIKEVIHYLRRG